MYIGVKHKDTFLKLLRKGKGEKLNSTLFSYSNHKGDLPCEFPLNGLSNDLTKKGGIRQDLLTGIIYLVLEDSSRQKEDKTYFKYIPKDLQIILSQVNINDLRKLGNDTRIRYNKLLEQLSENNDPFKGIFFDEQWELVGENLNPLKPKNQSKKLMIITISTIAVLALLIFGFKSCKSDNSHLPNEDVKKQQLKDSLKNLEQIDSLKVPNDSIPSNNDGSNMIINIQNSDSAKIEQINNFNNVNEVNL